MSEREYSIREAKEVFEEEKYFEHRPEKDTIENRRLFEAGYMRGYEAGIRRVKEEQMEMNTGARK